mmetsp:Transcript_23432/g.49060  ORF Transcript_23432/g.49060 Transcript_23432/m.49060 type:complete len:384 (-) Transcript_23432:63-1214(-)
METTTPQQTVQTDEESSPQQTSETDSKDSTQPPKEVALIKSNKHYFIAFGLLIIGGIAGMAAGFSNGNSQQASEFDLLDPSTWFPIFMDKNPHGGNTPYDFNIWDNQRSCRGLKLDIIDNLEPKWEKYFQRAVTEWENDDPSSEAPDALTLNVRKNIRYDPECRTVMRKMIVCNGDYGETDYIGINHVAIQFGYIISSVALLNDYFLENQSDALKQNTVCHELGHGFGLGHWDENFYNRDLGNCMDYTNSPKNNQSPDLSNFLFLEQMYGNTAGTSRYVEAGLNNNVEGLHCTPGSETVDFTEGTDIFKKRRLPGQPTITDDEFERIALLMSPGNNIIIADSSVKEHPLAREGWRYLKRTDKYEVHEQDLGDGLKIVSTIHLV